MDFSASRSRLGGGNGGPQMVKTYGRFRQRIVNREAKVAEDFARMTGARSLVSEMLDDSSSGSDLDPPPLPPQTSALMAKDSAKDSRQPVLVAAKKASREKRANSTAPNSSAYVSAEVSKPAIVRARKPKQSVFEQAGQLSHVHGRKEQPKKLMESARRGIPKPIRNSTSRQEDSATLALSGTAGSVDQTSKQEAATPKAKSPVADHSNDLCEATDIDLPDAFAFQKSNEQQPAESEMRVHATNKRAVGSRARSTSRQSPRKAPARPRKASKAQVDFVAEPPNYSVAAVRALTDEPALLATTMLPESVPVLTALRRTSRRSTGISAHVLADIAVHAQAPIQPASTTDEPGHCATLEATETACAKADHSPISGGNVTRRRTTAKGRRPTVADNRPAAVVDLPLLTGTVTIDNGTQPMASSGNDQTRSSATRRSGAILKKGPEEKCTGCFGTPNASEVMRRRSLRLSQLSAKPTFAIPALCSVDDVQVTQREECVADDPEEDMKQQRQLLGTRPMRFKAPRNARAQAFDTDDIDCEVHDEDQAETNTQPVLLSTPTRRRSTAQQNEAGAGTPQIAMALLVDTPRLHQTPTHSTLRVPVTDLSETLTATTPQKPKSGPAGHLSTVLHSPPRVATPHRVIYSPKQPMTQFKPAHTGGFNHGWDMNAATSLFPLPRDTPEASLSSARIDEPLGPSHVAVPQLRLSDGSLLGRMSTNGDVISELEIEETRVPFLPARRYVQKGHILAACGQTAPLDWVAGGLQTCGVLLPDIDSNQHDEAQMGEIESESGLCKIGEATYSEVFSAQWRYVPRTRYDNFNSKKSKVKGERLMQVALKIIPFGNSAVKSGTGEPQTTLRDLYQEIGATLALSRLSERERAKLQDARMQVKKPLKPKERELGANFVKAFRVCICQGPLPAPLLRAWDRWKVEYPELCENMRPDYYPPNQLFAVFVLEMGGETLENATVSTWKEARSIIRQLALSMALAERHNQFEHRDLHWGNIMVTRSNSNLTFLYQLPPTGTRVKSALMSIPSYKVRCTIIDYTLSRLHIDNDANDSAPNKPASYDPAKNVFFVALKDEALFQGEGDIQFDVYRQMRRCAKNDWEGFYPHTNVLWLTYAFQKILMTKSPDIKHELLAFAEGKLGPTFDAVSPDLRRAAGQELLKRWIKEFEQCESTSEVLKCALLDLYKS